MQRKSIIAIILYVFIGNCALLAQNNSLLEFRLEEYAGGAFVNFNGIMEDNNVIVMEEVFAKNLVQ